MNTRSFLFPLLLLAVSGAQAQALPADVGSLSDRPLNLSLRPAKALTDAAPMAPQQAVQATGQAPEPLPYGAGFETRQQGSTSGSSAGGSSTSGSSAGGTGRSGGAGGSGGGGRGGSGRGR